MRLVLWCQIPLIARNQMGRAAALLRTSDCHVRLGHFEWIAVYAPELLGEFTYQMMDIYYPEVGNDINKFCIRSVKTPQNSSQAGS